MDGVPISSWVSSWELVKVSNGNLFEFLYFLGFLIEGELGSLIPRCSNYMYKV